MTETKAEKIKLHNINKVKEAYEKAKKEGLVVSRPILNNKTEE